MDTNAQIVAAIVVLGLLIVTRLLSGRRRPKEKSFRCSRCATTATHTARTIEAWRSGKTKFFCNSCHSEWLRGQPQSRKMARGGGSGCLGPLIERRLAPRPHYGQPPAVPAPRKGGTVTVAGKLGIDMPAGTLNSILKSAGLKK
jgi:hypothetical protein